MRIHPSALQGLMTTIMEAHYMDLLAIKHAYSGNSSYNPETSNIKELEADIMSLIMRTVDAMDSGELNIFHGDYRRWLSEIGYLKNDPDEVDKSKC